MDFHLFPVDEQGGDSIAKKWPENLLEKWLETPLEYPLEYTDSIGQKICMKILLY